MNSSFAVIIAMLVQACDSTAQPPEMSGGLQVPLENPSIEEVLPQPMLPSALSCVLEQTETDSGLRVVASLIAPASGAKGHFSFSFDRKGSNSISIIRTSDFDLGPRTSLVLSETTSDAASQVQAVLEVDGKPVPCSGA